MVSGDTLFCFNKYISASPMGLAAVMDFFLSKIDENEINTIQ